VPALRAGLNRRARWLAAGAVVIAALALALWTAPAAPQRLVLTGIRSYQRYLSPYVARAGVRCRFTPSCSHYAYVSVRSHGVLRGGWRGVRRLARCGPWTPAGTVDPP
jgi:putative membrane protein insertion efficiency factor